MRLLLPLQALRKDDGGDGGGDTSGGSGPTQSAVHVDTVMGSPGAKRQAKKPRKKKTLLDYVPVPGVPLYGSVRKGEGPGHPFRGNQYVGGTSGTVHESPAVENMNDAGLLHHLAHHHPNVPLSEPYPGSNDIVEHSRIHHEIAHTEDHRTPGHDQHVHRDPYPTHQPLLNWLGRHPELMDLAQQALDPAGGEAVFTGLQNWGVPAIAAAALAELEDDSFSVFQTGGPKKLLGDARGLGHFLRGLVKKGEGPGHAFRGNQYTGGLGEGQTFMGRVNDTPSSPVPQHVDLSTVGNTRVDFSENWPMSSAFDKVKAKQAIDSLNGLQSRYPEVPVPEFKTSRDEDGIHGWPTGTIAATQRDGSIYLNPYFFVNDDGMMGNEFGQMIPTNRDYLAEDHAKLVANGMWAPDGDASPTEHIITHEFAHALGRFIGQPAVDRISAEARVMGFHQQVPQAVTVIDPNVARSGLREGLSKYAAASSHETIAEGFTEYKLSPHPRPIALYIGRALESEYTKNADITRRESPLQRTMRDIERHMT